MERFLRLFFLIVLTGLLMAPASTMAQHKRKKKKRYPHETPNTRSVWSDNKIKSKAKKTRILQIVKYKPHKVLYGNKCVEEYTRRLGFEYVIGMPDEDGDADLYAFFSNMGNRVLLTFRNGPFWSCRVRRRIKQCRLGSGDFMGALPGDLPPPQAQATSGEKIGRLESLESY